MADDKPPVPPLNYAPPVTVVDFDMPFGSMVVFMVKWAIAAIPAPIILIVVGGIAGVSLAGLLGAGAILGTRASPQPFDAADMRPHNMSEWHDKCDQWQGPDDMNTATAQLCRQELQTLSK